MPQLFVFSRRRVILAILLGLCVAGLCYVRGYSAFAAVRLRLVTEPVAVQTGTVTVPVPVASDPQRTLRPPFALIVSARGSERQTLQVRIDGHEVCSVEIHPGEPRRFDCAVRSRVDTEREHEIVVQGSAPWSLHYLELASHHGGNGGMLEFHVVPSASPAGTTSAPLALILGLLVGVASLARPAPLPRWLGRIHLAISGLAVVVVCIALASPYLTPFTVVFYYKTLAVLAVLVLYPRWWSVTSAVLAKHADTATDMRRRIIAGSALVALLVGGGFWTVTNERLAGSDGNYTRLIQISRDYFSQNPLFEDREDVRNAIAFNDGGGYDGQFMYFMTFDPLLRRFAADPEMYRRVVDAPAYRFGRVGFSWLTFAVSLGQWQGFAPAMVWLVLLGTALTAVGVAVIGARTGRTPMTGLLVLLIPGFWISTQVALPEPVAACLLTAGFIAATNRRYVIAAIALAASLVVRETGAILILCLVLGLIRREGVRFSTMWLACVAAPVVCWRIYVGATLFPALGPVAFFENPQDLGVPFAGLWTMASMSWSGDYHPEVAELARAGIWFPVVLTVGLVTAARLLFSRRDPLALAAVAYAMVAVSLNFDMIWVHVGNGQRGTYELFLVMALLTVTGTRQQSRLDRAAIWAFWCLSAAYVFYGYFDAGYLRSALLS